ncbi:MAG: hypothetical protein NVS9B1_02710 [Candidatus Dormibacteraceae bacterium]
MREGPLDGRAVVYVLPQAVASPPPPAPVHPDWAPLAATVAGLAAGAGTDIGVRLVELDGSTPGSWDLQGDRRFDAASTYKLVVLMAEADRIAGGGVDPAGPVCFEEADWEPGWYDDYRPGSCFSRAALASRAGLRSDNTAGHMLVRDIGGPAALNAFARRHGATGDGLFEGNWSTADDLAALIVAEARGEMGGRVAQEWTAAHTTGSEYEDGIPAGVPPGARVYHKTGALDGTRDDAALVVGGPNGRYVLVIMSRGGTGGWPLLRAISAAVWAYEASRP